MPAAPKQCGSALHEFHCLLPLGSECNALQELHCPLSLGSEALHCTSSTAQCPWAVWQCMKGVPLRTAPRRCGSALHDLHFHYPLVVWRPIAGVP